MAFFHLIVVIRYWKESIQANMNLTMKSLNLDRIFKKGNLGKCLLANRVILKINLSLGLPSGFLLPSGVECGAIFKVTWDQH